jgi:hypothetical protein
VRQIFPLKPSTIDAGDEKRNFHSYKRTRGMYQIFKIFSIMIFVWVHRLLKFLGKFTAASDLIHPSSSQETLTDCIQAIV